MSTLPVDHDIPMREQRSNGGYAKRSYPFHDLQVGDSFFVSSPDCEINRLWNSLGKTRSYYEKRYSKKFPIRRVTGGLRVWRAE